MISYDWVDFHAALRSWIASAHVLLIFTLPSFSRWSLSLSHCVTSALLWASSRHAIYLLLSSLLLSSFLKSLASVIRFKLHFIDLSADLTSVQSYSAPDFSLFVNFIRKLLRRNADRTDRLNEPAPISTRCTKSDIFLPVSVVLVTLRNSSIRCIPSTRRIKGTFY